jgi:hypothetical protein
VSQCWPARTPRWPALSPRVTGKAIRKRLRVGNCARAASISTSGANTIAPSASPTQVIPIDMASVCRWTSPPQSSAPLVHQRSDGPPGWTGQRCEGEGLPGVPRRGHLHEPPDGQRRQHGLGAWRPPPRRRPATQARGSGRGPAIRQACRAKAPAPSSAPGQSGQPPPQQEAQGQTGGRPQGSRLPRGRGPAATSAGRRRSKQRQREDFRPQPPARTGAGRLRSWRPSANPQMTCVLPFGDEPSLEVVTWASAS